MCPNQLYKLIYSPVARSHLKVIDRKYYPLIRHEIETQLQFEPDVETRNRKPLKRLFIMGGEWEIRFGPQNQFLVFYEVNREDSEVYILAIGIKIRDKLFLGGKEIA